MSFEKMQVTVIFDVTVREERLESIGNNVAYEMAHKIRVALSDSKDYLISMPLVEMTSEPK